MTVFKADGRYLKFVVAALFLSTAALMVEIPFSMGGLALSVFVYFLTTGLGVSATFHRNMCHGAFEFKSIWLHRLCAYFGAVGCTASPIGWVIVHRVHHAHGGTERDPHRPEDGLLRMLKLNYETGDFNLIRAREFTRDPFHMFLHKNYYLVVIAHALAIYVLAGPWGLLYGFTLPAMFQIVASISVNYIAHTWGSQPHGDLATSRNNRLLAALTWGEGNHNNHHNSPRAWNYSERWDQIDITGIVLRFLFFIGLARRPICHKE